MNPGILTSGYSPPQMPLGLLGRPTPIPLYDRTYHPEAIDWLNRVTANGGSASADTLKAVSDFCTGIDYASLRRRFWRMSLCCGDQYVASLVPLYRGPTPSGRQFGYATDAGINFVSANYITSGSSTGLSIGPNGGQKFLVTGLAISDFYTASTGLHLGCATSAVAFGGAFIGVAYGGGFPNRIIQNNGLQSQSDNNTSSAHTVSHTARKFFNSEITTGRNRVLSNGVSGGSFGFLPINNVPTGFISVMASSTSSTTANTFLNPQVNNLRVLMYSVGAALSISENGTVDALLSNFLAQIGRTT